MRVVHIIDRLNVGGAQKQVLVFASQARAYGINMTVISLSEEPDSKVEAELREYGIPVATFPAPRLFQLRRLNQLIQILRDGNFDIIQTHLHYSNILGSLAGRLVNIPVVSMLHSTGYSLNNKTADLIKDKIEHLALRYLSTHVIAVGFKVADVYQSHLRRKSIEVISNAVSTISSLPDEERISVRKELSISPSQPVLITVGRFVPPKSYEDLVDAFAKLLDEHPNTVLIMIGDGPLFSRVKAHITSLNLQESVRLLGERDDVPRFLASSDVYVSSSIWEGLPMAVLEAMMAGLPVVATEVGDIPRIIDSSVGRVVPASKPKLLASAIEFLLDNDSARKKMGIAAQEYAVHHFSVDIWMEKLLNLYRLCLESDFKESFVS
jgi:glycosyltransferase involved in cell wall biosynthesis